ncbi:MAG TPA: PilZ domain-containing protein [Polyangia bacterium]|nr:PilZ domain-containing protein [Polyangia bacterium]
MRSTTNPRILHLATVKLEPAPPDGVIDALAVNLSVGGLFVESQQLLDPGAQVSLTVDLLDGGAPIQAQAQVVWVREDSGPRSAEPAGMALRFVGLDETSSKRIERVVAGRSREPASVVEQSLRVRFPGLPSALRANARDLSEQGVVLEAELPWLQLGGGVAVEVAPGEARTGRMRWVGVDVSASGAARLRISVDFAGRPTVVPDALAFTPARPIEAATGGLPDTTMRMPRLHNARPSWLFVLCLLATLFSLGVAAWQAYARPMTVGSEIVRDEEPLAPTVQAPIAPRRVIPKALVPVVDKRHLRRRD